MRRNMSRGRGPVNRGPGPGSIRDGTASSGPLMTEHIKLHDLDLELALLKRKREIIEQQQNMLQTRYTRPTPYDNNDSYNQQYNEPQRFNRTSNFSHLYDDSPDSHFDRQHGTKRQADNWQNHTPPKRFSAPQRPQKSGNRPSYGPRSSQPGSSGSSMTNRSQNNMGRASNAAQHQTFSDEPAPLMGYGFRPKTGPRPRKNFNPTKVTKPKPTSAPNKLNALPVAARRNLVDQASDLVNKSPDKNSNIFLSIKQASRQLLGRLELALGIIMKDLRQDYGAEEQHINSFKSVPCLRAMKKVIRERIRGVMLGKTVGPAIEVVNIYREKYPKETDSEILNLALEATHNKESTDLAISLIETETPEKYFKLNFTRLLDVKLDEMFGKLKDLYEKDPANQRKIFEEVETTITEDGKNEPAPENKDADNVIETEESVKESQEPDGTADVEMDNSKADVEKQEDSNAVTEETAENPESIEKAESDEKTETDEKEGSDEKAESGEKAESADKEESPKKDETPVTPKNSKAEFYNSLIDELLNQKLPSLLPKYKEQIMKILNVDAAFRKTKAAFIMKTNEKAAVIQESKNRRTEPRTTVNTNDAKDKPPRILQHFVKILGKPVLPKKPLMRSFLDQFNPASIKKHRGIPNLLFVGFADKEDFDNILAANKTVIGKSTVDIKVSEKFKNNEKKSLDDSDVQMIEVNKEPIEIVDDDVDKIDTELEDQITDLLSTIREDQEKSDMAEGINKEKSAEDNKQNNAVEKTEEALNGAENEEPETTDEKNLGTIEEKETENENADENKTEEPAKNGEPNNGVEELKNEANESGKGTPTRASTRLATSTPSTIKTRRASKLAQN